MCIIPPKELLCIDFLSRLSFGSDLSLWGEADQGKAESNFRQRKSCCGSHHFCQVFWKQLNYSLLHPTRDQARWSLRFELLWLFPPEFSSKLRPELALSQSNGRSPAPLDRSSSLSKRTSLCPPSLLRSSHHSMVRDPPHQRLYHCARCTACLDISSNAIFTHRSLGSKPLRLQPMRTWSPDVCRTDWIPGIDNALLCVLRAVPVHIPLTVHTLSGYSGRCLGKTRPFSHCTYWDSWDEPMSNSPKMWAASFSDSTFKCFVNSRLLLCQAIQIGLKLVSCFLP